MDEDDKKSRLSVAQKARGGMTEFDRDEAIMNSVLNEPIRKTKANPGTDESTQKSHEEPSKKAGKTPTNPAKDESTQKSNEKSGTSKATSVSQDESTRGGSSAGRVSTNPAQDESTRGQQYSSSGHAADPTTDESTQKSYEMRGGRPSGVGESTRDSAMEGGSTTY